MTLSARSSVALQKTAVPDSQTRRPVVSMSAASSQWRLELFFKSQEELTAQLPFLQRHNIKRLNLTNKADTDDLLASVRTLQEGIPGLDVCVHYSLKYNYHKTPLDTFNTFETFCAQLQQQMGLEDISKSAATDTTGVTATGDKHSDAATQETACHLLLVSGGGKKKQFDTVVALQQVEAQLAQQQCVQPDRTQDGSRTQQQQQQQQQQVVSHVSKKHPRSDSCSIVHQDQRHLRACWPSFAVAFNPYLPNEQEAATERNRLRAKLTTGLVDRIYLQMGTDLDRLHAGLDYASSLCDELYSSVGKQRPQLLGSVFIPSKRLLAQMRFRPWNGVFLSPEYLSSVSAADGITRQILQRYAEADVVPLIESPIKKDDELAHALDLLSLVRA